MNKKGPKIYYKNEKRTKENQQFLHKNGKQLELTRMYLCGYMPSSCKDVEQMDQRLQELVFDDEIYIYGSFMEEASHVLEVIHRARSCILQNELMAEYHSPKNIRFSVCQHIGKHAKEKKAKYNFKLLRTGVEKCPRRMVGIRVGLYSPGHMNMLVFDKINRKIEHYEPQGELPPDRTSDRYRTVIAALRNILRAVFPEYTFVAAVDICPNVRFGSGKLGAQAILNETRPGSRMAGTCAVWSLWYLHVRLAFPGLSPHEALLSAMSLALKINKTELTAGLTPECAKLIRDPKDQSLCWDVKRGRLRAATQLEKKCPGICNYAGDALEEFITRFTVQLVSIVDLRIQYVLGDDGSSHPTKQEAVNRWLSLEPTTELPIVTKKIVSGLNDRLILERQLEPKELQRFVTSEKNKKRKKTSMFTRNVTGPPKKLKTNADFPRSPKSG